MKKCTTCLELKPFSEFYRHNRDKYRAVCTVCKLSRCKKVTALKNVNPISNISKRNFLKERLELIKAIAYKKWPEKYTSLFEFEISQSIYLVVEESQVTGISSSFI